MTAIALALAIGGLGRYQISINALPDLNLLKGWVKEFDVSKVIEETTEKLIAKIQSSCPNCSYPGFDIKEFKEGLPCEWCNRPTKSILSLLYHCNKCGFEKEEWFPKNKEKEDPQYCDYCNP